METVWETQNTITRGHVQYMSAGTGVYHSEHSFGEDILRLLQIWIFPNKKGYILTMGNIDLTGIIDIMNGFTWFQAKMGMYR
ncbi:hypothetical protein GCM10008908_02300 [Clostridium subterminale]|uniref:Pirin N-terminal domain-containing protein n=1 Tax=Clostridium subterminale TaxID=1550 RepID=A0ABN1KFR8_CLOSU